MTYILDNANVWKEKKLMNCSLLIKNDKVDYISEKLTRLNFMRSDLSDYLLTPGHVMLNYTFSNRLPFQSFKDEMIHKYLENGCTTLLVISDVDRERDLSKVVSNTRNYLLNSPVDYYIGIQIPLKILTPSLLIGCRRLKIPVIFVVIEETEELFHIPWGWIREAYFSYQIPLIPKWKNSKKKRLPIKKYTELWNEIMNDNSIPTIPECPQEEYPLALNDLKKIGIYPAKGDIRIGGEVDYNLYEMNDIGFTVEEIPILDYHKLKPKITINKGKVVKADSDVYFRPGFGNECIVKKPGFFQTLPSG